MREALVFLLSLMLSLASVPMAKPQPALVVPAATATSTALPTPTITSCDGTVSFGSDVPAGWFLTINPGGDPDLLLTGPFNPLPRTFAPGTYNYTWHSAQDLSDLARADIHMGGGTFAISSCGDICHSGTTQAPATAAFIEAQPNDLVFTVGDNDNQDGSQSEYTDCVAPNWGAFANRSFPSPGNHDYDTAGAVPTLSTRRQQGQVRFITSYYLQNNWMVIVLNANCSYVTGGCGSGSPEETWLRWNLWANSGKHIIAIWHQPEFSSGSEHGSINAYLSWWQDLYAANASIVINGHDHDYERFAPQSPTGVADPNGVREFVVGTGGADQYSWGTIQPNSEMRCPIGTYGVLQLTLHTSSYDWQFIPVAGGTCTDSGTTATPASTPRPIGTASTTPTATLPAAPTPTPTPTPAVAPTATPTATNGLDRAQCHTSAFEGWWVSPRAQRAPGADRAPRAAKGARSGWWLETVPIRAVGL